MIAGLIITSSIAATMYLFRVGFDSLQRVNAINEVSSRVPPAVNLLKGVDLSRLKGSENLGGGVTVNWQAEIIAKADQRMGEDGAVEPMLHEISLYRVTFTIVEGDVSRDYEYRTLRHRKNAEISF
jgi:hypothetical protein